MNAKEKAKELVDKMWIYSIPNVNGSWNNAKQCALICVNEMLDIRNGLYINEGSLVQEYLLKVKKEIELL